MKTRTKYSLGYMACLTISLTCLSQIHHDQLLVWIITVVSFLAGMIQARR